MTQEDPNGSAIYPILMAIIVAMAAFWALQDSAWLNAGGVFEYPLDDPYIHLAMAEQLRQGGYGVNAGEYAAASSSPLFSFLLLPFAGTEWHRYVPLFWNVVGLILSAGLWGKIVAQSAFGSSYLGIFIAASGPLLLNMVGVSFIGMEHSLHLAATLAIVSGLIGFADTRKANKLLLLGLLLSPLLRLEGLALVVMVVVVAQLRGRFKTSLVLLIIGISLPLAFTQWLMWLGLEAMPSSVTAKLALPTSAESIGRYLQLKAEALWDEPGSLVLAGFLAAAIVIFLASRHRRSVVFAASGAAVGHMLFGGFGWMDRYEVYIVAGLAGALVAAAGNRRVLHVVLLLPMAGAGYHYLPDLVREYPHAPRAVHLQQAQMARFAKEHVKAPVAVNDLGHVAWQNPDYVLDLWGLASREARVARLTNDTKGWADGMAAARGVKIAMIYERWLEDAIGEDWQRLGTLKTSDPVDYLGDPEVVFYLTDADDPAPYVARLKDWAAGLPDGAAFTFADGLGQ